MSAFSGKLSRVAREIEPSRILALTAQAQSLREQGRDIISLAAGEPDFMTPEPARAAGIRAIEDGATRYTAAAGEPALRRALAERYSQRWDRALSPEQVCVSNGAKPALYCLVSILLDPGDELLYPLPYWASYEPIVRMRGGVPVAVPTRREDAFKLRAEALDAAAGPRAKVLLLNSPGNPTGTVYSREELLPIAEVARAHDLLILSDEIYESLVFDGRQHQSLYTLTPWMPERTVVVSGFSKSYAMTGWRIGYAIGDAELVASLAKYQSHSHSCPSQISQRAALGALAAAEDSITTMRAAFARRLSLCREKMRSLGLPFIDPEGAFYLFFEVGEVCARRSWAGGDEFCARFLDDAGVVMIPGSAFGMPDWVRLSFATGEAELSSAFARMARWLA